MQFWSLGKKNESYVEEGIALFTRRINFYYKAEWKIIAPPRQAASLQSIELKRREAELVLELLHKDDILVALDERGKQWTDETMAGWIEKKSGESVRNLVFLIGGAYGLDEAVLKRATFVWSLSNLVFPHQLVRLILAEQIYRACTIIKNEKYHHQ